jgi:hypothetical protein
MASEACRYAGRMSRLVVSEAVGPSGEKDDAMSNDREEQLRQRAYEIWEAEGRPEGRHKDHWHQAERELAEYQNANPTGATPKSAVVETRSSPVRRPRRVTSKSLGHTRPQKTFRRATVSVAGE